MEIRLSKGFGLVVVGLLYVSAFSGLSVDQPTLSPEAARVGRPATTTTFVVEPVVPFAVETDHPPACQPLNAAGPSCGEHELGVEVGRMVGVERWRPLVERHFRPQDVERALAVIRCESNGDPGAANPRSSARGLFQHLHSLWGERTARAGMAGADIFNPEDNVALAAWLVYEGGGWRHWNPSRHCWR